MNIPTIHLASDGAVVLNATLRGHSNADLRRQLLQLINLLKAEHEGCLNLAASVIPNRIARQ